MKIIWNLRENHDVNHQIKISIVSPEQIKSWIFGEITISISLGARIHVMGPDFRGSVTFEVGPIELTEESVRSWIGAGAACLGMGAKLISKDLLARRDWPELARRAIKAKYPQPFFWAVFILHGEG